MNWIVFRPHRDEYAGIEALRGHEVDPTLGDHGGFVVSDDDCLVLQKTGERQSVREYARYLAKLRGWDAEPATPRTMAAESEGMAPLEDGEEPVLPPVPDEGIEPPDEEPIEADGEGEELSLEELREKAMELAGKHGDDIGLEPSREECEAYIEAVGGV
jgi:hypothetical protein